MSGNVLRRLLLVLVLCPLSLAHAAPSAAPKVLLQEVLATERTRFAAMTRADIAVLRRVLGDELTYTHTTGAVDTKTSLLAAIGSGRVRYVSIAVSELKPRLYGATAVVTGRGRMTVQAASPTQAARQRVTFGFRFTDAYVRRAGRWQLAAWQSTRVDD